MSIQITNFTKEDIEGIKEINFFISLEIQWNGDFKEENVIVAKIDNNVVGVGALSMISDAYYMDQDIEHRFQIELAVKEDCDDCEKIKEQLLDGLKNILKQYQEENPNKQIAICSFEESTHLSEIQWFLKRGFCVRRSIPVLAYNLEQEIKHYHIPSNIVIENLEINEKNVNALIKATEEANDGIGDSTSELWFRTGGPGFTVLVAKDGDKIVSAVTLWEIGDGRSATENIFTIPEYRRKNIAREVIACGLQELKKRGQKLATLSLQGENQNAMRLYQSLGYELLYFIMELHYN